MPSDTYKSIIEAAEAFLKETNSTDPGASKSNRQIVNAIRARNLDIDVTDGTILNYLSHAANNNIYAGTRIVSGGPRAGYWYEAEALPETTAKPVDQQTITVEKGEEPITVVEKDLYPLMELWLEQKGYTAKDLSNLKGGGRWGNPDIIGADRVEIFGAVQIELASCEIKLNDGNWETMIFEAISHKRFSNRSWFCYRVQDESRPIPKDMEYYAERYRVGIVHIILSDAELIELKKDQKKPLDYFERVVEKVPALYDFVPLREQKELIERAKISLSLSF